MSKRLSLAGVAGLLLLPWVSQGAVEKSCWLRDASVPANSHVIALCQQGGVWATADGGTSWVKHETGTTEQLRAMAFLDAKRGFIVGDRGVMVATEDGGTQWKAVPLDTTQHLMDIGFVGEQGWTVGYQGVILHTADGGRTWTKQTTKTTQTLETVFFLDTDHGWVVGWAGTLLRTTDGGKTWEQVNNNASWSLTSVYFRDANNGWMVGFAGQILRSKDGGMTWQSQTAPIKSWFTAVCFDGAGRGWIAYDDGFLVSEDKGETWKPVQIGRRSFLSKLFRVGDSLWAIGQSGMLRQTNGSAWAKIESLAPSGTPEGLTGATKNTAEVNVRETVRPRGN